MSGTKKAIQVISAILLALSFFLTWVNWDGSKISGMSIATGEFFSVSENRFGLENPFPAISFTFYSFWLIPALALVIAFFQWSGRKTTMLSFITGSISLAMVTMYVLFTRVLIDLGVSDSLTAMLKPGLYLHAFAAISLILTAFPVKNQGWKIGWLLLGPVLAFGSFKLMEGYVLGETHEKTEQLQADYTLSAPALINEFLQNDTAANRKYLEKILEVNGSVSSVDILPDSSATIKFADSTGSYAIFSFDKNQMEELQKIKAGDLVTVKGVCSGSIFSEILGTSSISFKRSTLAKK